jgi:energy-coupling factor transporter ATP-binding protein EcfA2
MIALHNVHYTYPGSELPTLHELTLSVPSGQFCALVGPNRAGKSTLCYVLSGFIPHFYRGKLAGDVQVAGVDVPRTSLAELAGVVGLVFQNPFNQISGARFSVREEVAFGLENLGVPREEILPRVDQALALVGLGALADRSPYALSGGEQQRLALASVMVMRPKVLVLDEPTAQLDPRGTRAVFEALRRISAQGKTTVFMVEHKLEWVATFADRVVVLEQGRLVADGDPRAILGSPAAWGRGVGRTRYTEAAQRGGERGLIHASGPLPVTLEQATRFFQ